MIDEKERWTAKRIRLALRVAEAAVVWAKTDFGDEDSDRRLAEVVSEYRKFIKARGLSREPRSRKTASGIRTRLSAPDRRRSSLK